MLVMKVIKMNDGGRLVEMEVIKGFGSGRGDADDAGRSGSSVVVVSGDVLCLCSGTADVLSTHTHTRMHSRSIKQS